MRKIFILMGLVAMLPMQAKAEALKAGDTAPCLKINTLQSDGKTVQKSTCDSSLAGKKLVLEFFSTTCQVCVEKLPFFESMASKLGSKAVFRIMDIDSDLKIIQNFFRSRNTSKYEIGLDLAGDSIDAFKLEVTPTIAVIGNGKIIYLQEGFTSEADEEENLRKALE